jgi:non-reducing end alpha-L-arabinofuranosidase
MKMRINRALTVALPLTLIAATWTMAGQTGTPKAAMSRPQGPCDIYAAAGDPCVAAHSTTRALYASYNGPLYKVLRQSDGKSLDIGVVKPSVSDAGGYANAAAQDAFCASTYCWIATIYDQSPKHNGLTQAPRGNFSGPAMGGVNNLPVADMAPITIMGHKAYGAFIEPGMGLRNDAPRGTAVDDQAEGQYWVINGRHFNSGCCFDYGNAEIDSRDDDNGTMETTYFGNAGSWYHGNTPGPWVMTDQENNLVGCVNSDPSKLCVNLPNITWRFVTGIAKGEPHHWTSMGGDAQQGALQVMFDGPRVNGTYDPMRKQGAILLGNGGDNSVGSQGTFYEGAMTAANTFPKDATDQLVQANIAAAKYDVSRLSLAPASATATPPGLQTFTPGSSQETTVTFTNVTGTPVTGVKLSVATPKQWTASVEGGAESSKTFADAVAPGASVSATFKVTSGPAAFNGDLVGSVSWMSLGGGKRSETTVEKVRNVSPIKINEFRVGAGGPNPTNSFIELYNAGSKDVDLSNWSLTEHQTVQAIFSAVKIPAGTKLPAGGFYVLGLSNSGLVAAARVGTPGISVRNTTGMSTGDTIVIDSGANAETRKIVTVGGAAGNSTTLWQPLPDGPIITIPAGATNVPVTSVAGFTVGEKIALGYGAKYPAVGLGQERYEVATVTAVGKQGTEALLGADAPAGSTNLKVTSVANISAGDTIRLDIASVSHGIETVTVTKVGTQSSRGSLLAAASAGTTKISVRGANGFAVGDKLIVGTPANKETVTVAAIGASGSASAGGFGPPPATVDVTPALAQAHANGENVVNPGTGLDLAAPLRFNHAANLPFSDRGTGITFAPATAFAHLSNEPVQPLGTGITLDKPLAKTHAIDAVVRDASVTSAGYQGTPAPNQWFGGPALSASAGNMALRDATGLVVDSLNYGLLVDPWTAEGYQATSGAVQSGCKVPVPSAPGGFGPPGASVAIATNRSSGRFPDGVDTDSNCADFRTQAATTLPVGARAGATNIKVANVADFDAGQTVVIDSGDSTETAVIATVGTGGASTVATATETGATVLPVAGAMGFVVGQTISVDSGASAETAVIASVAGGRGGARITLAAPLARAHAASAQVSGTGITLAGALTRTHASGAQIASDLPTPGAPNKYSSRPH